MDIVELYQIRYDWTGQALLVLHRMNRVGMDMVILDWVESD